MKKRCYSNLMVLRSNAGFYIGTLWYDGDGIPSPGSRESGYFRTKEDAEKAMSRPIIGCSEHDICKASTQNLRCCDNCENKM